MDEPPRDPSARGPDAASPPKDRLVLHGGEALAAALRAVARDPRATALFCDIDGTISPIVSDPYRAVVPARFRAALAALAPRLGLLAVVTGRDVRQGASMVGVHGATYVGLHGFDVMAPDGTVSRDPSAAPYVERVQSMAARVAGLDAAGLGLVVENKGPMLDLHYRQAADPAATLAVLESEILSPARALGLTVATGHFLVELRPPEPVDKGTAVRRLLSRALRDVQALRTAIFMGDDLTDCNGFAAVHRWAGGAGGETGDEEQDGLPAAAPLEAVADDDPAGRAGPCETGLSEEPAGRTAVAVAALTAETPQRVRDEADVWVAATPGVYEVLTRLLAASGAGVL